MAKKKAVVPVKYERPYPPEYKSVSPKLTTKTGAPMKTTETPVKTKSSGYSPAYRAAVNWEGRISHIHHSKKPERISKNNEARL